MKNEINETILTGEDKIFLDFAVNALEKGNSLSLNLQKRLVHLLHQMHHKSVSQAARVERDKRAEESKTVIIFKPKSKRNPDLPMKNHYLVEWKGLNDN